MFVRHMSMEFNGLLPDLIGLNYIKPASSHQHLMLSLVDVLKLLFRMKTSSSFALIFRVDRMSNRGTILNLSSPFPKMINEIGVC